MALWRDTRYNECNVDILAGFSGVAGLAGQYKLAAKLFGATESAYKNLQNWEMDFVDHMTYDPIIAKVRDQLGKEVFDKEWKSGEQMSLSEAIEYAMRSLR